MEENKILTKENKNCLFKLLLNKKEEDLQTGELYNFIENDYKNKFYKYIRNLFKDHIEILDRYEKIRESFRISGNSVSIQASDISEDLKNYPKKINGVRSEGNLIRELKLEDYIGDLNECEKYPALLSSRNIWIRLGYPENLPNIDVLIELAKKLGLNTKLETIKHNMLDILSPEELKDLRNIVSEILHRNLIRYNYLRIFKYPKDGSSVYSMNEFLWNIKTWGQLKELNEDWYNILVNNLSEVEDFDLSGKSIEDILENIDKDFGL